MHEINPAVIKAQPWSVLQGWFDFYAVEPYGDERADYRVGIAAAGLANIWGKPKGKKGFSASDFMPDFSDGARTSRVVSPTDQFKKLLAAYTVAGFKVEDKRNANNLRSKAGSSISS